MQNFTNYLDIPIIKKSRELYSKTHKLIFTLPKFERYSLGERMETALLELIELVVMANAEQKLIKENTLLKANAKNETLKIFYSLAFELKLMDFKKYIDFESQLIENGKMINGWIKYCRNQK